MRSIAVPVLVILLSASALCSSLGDYGRRIGEARGIVDNKFADNNGRGLDRLRTLLPAREQVEAGETTIDVDNGWLDPMINAYSAAGSNAAKIAALTAISERLAALDQTVKEMQTAQAANASKDQDKLKLAEILSRPEYRKPEEPKESLIQKWIREFWEWLENVFPSPDIKPGAVEGVGSFKLGLQILVFVLIAVALGFLLYKFGPHVLARIRTKEKAVGREDRVILGEHVAAETSGDDLFSEAERLAKRGDIRGAIRKGYIAALCELSDRRLLRLARHKTNRDYLSELNRKTPIHQTIRTMTGAFETSWYGLRAVDTGDWDEFSSLYRQTLREVSARK